jgi:asparagine synthase (glutamine-hydrolysing)
MCGIAGIINFHNQSVQKIDLQQMMQVMKHRGPNDEGTFIHDLVGLGFVRLSILDLSSAGHQPMTSSDGRYCIVFNGEIYNYIELRKELEKLGYEFKTKTDTEVLLSSYVEWGEDCLNRFNGMWAFVIYDMDRNKIFGARDRYGIKPFYYTFFKDDLLFASEIQPILSILPANPVANKQTIFDYLVFNRTDQTEATFFEGINKLQHGHSFTVDLKNRKHEKPDMKIKRWYNLKEKAVDPFSGAEEYLSVFSSAVGLRLRSDVPVGVCLSGGLDSSSIVSVLLNDYKKNDLNTFSAVYNKREANDESEYIAEYKNSLSNMFFTTPTVETLYHDLNRFIRAHGEPIPSTAPYAQFKVMELAAKHVVVTLDGQGADEELAGYHYFFGLFFKELLKKYRFRKLFKETTAYYRNHRSLYGIYTLLYFILPTVLRTRARVREKGYLLKSFERAYSGENTIAGNLYASSCLKESLIDHFEYKLEHLLKWEDRNSMYFSLEARVPFLDYRLVEKTIAGADVIHDGMTKYILREAMKGTLPEKIRVRKDKIGFDTPQDRWFRTEPFSIFISDLLTSESFRSRNIIAPSKAKAFYHQHLSGKKNISKEIWKWIHLELWYREFID